MEKNIRREHDVIVLELSCIEREKERDSERERESERERRERERQTQKKEVFSGPKKSDL